MTDASSFRPMVDWSTTTTTVTTTIDDVDTVNRNSGVLLCASCDRCRARKTKCDGQRPCGACVKQTGLASIEGVPYHVFGCVYSPAKKRGPNPGHNKRKSGGEASGLVEPPPIVSSSPSAAAASSSSPTCTATINPTLSTNNSRNNIAVDEQQQERQREHQMSTNSHHHINTNNHNTTGGVANQQYHHQNIDMLQYTHPVGSMLRSYYELSINEMFRLVPSTTATEVSQPEYTPSMSSVATTVGCQFAELALGALVKNDIKLAHELCNAVVHCLQEAIVQHHPSGSYDIAKTYYLLGVFRAFRGDFARYFKYRRVCLLYLSKLPSDHRTYALVAAISYLDCWAYMLHNAEGDDIACQPIPVNKFSCSSTSSSSSAATAAVDETERKFRISKEVGRIALNPDNQIWIQGPPPVFLNNDAPVQSRVLDALSCAVRTCCDTANGRFYCNKPTLQQPSATATAVMAHEDELCSRNMILSAHSLLMMQPDNARSDGQLLVITAMAAFFENPDEGNILSDGQISTLLSVCDQVIQNPLLLYHAGPTYHMITNAAVLLAHFLNGLIVNRESLSTDELDLYDDVHDTYTAIRRTLTLHRQKLPAKIRCHDLPRSTIDLGTDALLLCSSRGCQGFVLQACSPCVAAERATRAAEQLKQAEAAEAAQTALESGEFSRKAFSDFDLDDDALLDMINGLIQQ